MKPFQRQRGLRDPAIAALAAALWVALFLACPTPRFDGENPLPWDMSHHYLGALSIRDAIRDASVTRLAAALQEGDLYPPGHSAALGIWLLAFGEANASIRAFQLCGLLLLIAALWFARCGLPVRDQTPFLIAAAATLLLTTPVTALSKSLMVEVPATVLAMASLVLLGGSRIDSIRAAVGLMAMIAACILTKYNIGLPLLPVGLILSTALMIRGERKRATLMVMATLGAMALWIAFLAWQQNGWQNFLAFARNRANAENKTFFARMLWYLDFYRSSFVPKPWVAWAFGALALLGLSQFRNRLALGAGVYLGSSLIALGRHPYLLDRNLVSISAALAIPIGCGVCVAWHLLRDANRVARAIVVSGGVLALAWALSGAPGQARAWCAHLRPPATRSLAGLSRHLGSQFSRCQSCLVVGAFNEFSPAWLTILWHRGRPGGSGGLTVDLPYPLTTGRERTDPRPDPSYEINLSNWVASAAAETVITIDVLPGSAFDTNDYKMWNAWKHNYVNAFKDSPWFLLLDTRLEAEGGIRVRTYRRLEQPLRYPTGWGPGEDWGRWAVQSEATILVPELPCASRLALCVAAYEGMRGAQRCEVDVDGVPSATFELAGRPWQWERREIPLGDAGGAGDRQVTLRFPSLWPGNDTDRPPRALPFARIVVEASSAANEGCDD